VCGEIFCGDCVIRKCPYFVPDEDDDEAAEAQGDGNGPASPGAEFRNTLALAVVDTNTVRAGSALSTIGCASAIAPSRHL
jgi:hypothetical protein